LAGAIFNGHAQIVDLLIKSGANISTTYQASSLGVLLAVVNSINLSSLSMYKISGRREVEGE